MLARLGAAWTGYWFAPGFTLSIAIARICLFAGVLESLTRLPFWWAAAESWYARVSMPAYRPKGLVQLFFPTTPPPAELVDLLLGIAAVASVMAILGLCTRAACITATLLAWFLHGLAYSFVAIWSHPHNVIVLTAIAFMLGRPGDTLSVDALIHRLLGEPSAADPSSGRYAWPVLLGQMAVALFYFGAFWRKVAGPHDTFELHWVFSDSMRNMLIQPWHVADLPLPAHVAFVAAHPLAWQAVAVGHLLTQALPLLACLHVHRPWLRLGEGFVFATGVLLLGLFMGYWNEHWLFLVVFFVDWDYFAGLLRPAGLRPA